MFGFNISHTRTRTSHINASQPLSLHSAADSTPEPETTASGVAPGEALYDKRTPTPEPESSTRPYSLRTTRFLTEKIGPWNSTIARLKVKRANRKTPSKKSSNGSLKSATSRKSATTDAASDPESNHPGYDNDSLGGATSQPSERGDEADSAVHRHRLQTGTSGAGAAAPVPQIPQFSFEVPRVANVEGLGLSSRAPGDAADTAGERIGSQSQLADDFWDFSVDHEKLERDILRHAAAADPDHLSQVEPHNLQAILGELLKERPAREARSATASQQASQQASEASQTGNQGRQADQVRQIDQIRQTGQVTQAAPSASGDSRQVGPHGRRRPQGQAHTIRPPRQAVQVERIGHVALGGGHHLNQLRIINRPGQSSHNPDANANTDTEPETELEPESEPEIEHQDEIIKPIVAPSNLRRLFNPQSSSPSPLPSAHQPIDPHTCSTLDLPFGYDQPSQTSQTHPAICRLPPRNDAGPSRPRGNARQEASRARRASKPAPRVPEATDPEPKLPPAMNQALNIARARYRLRLRVERERRTKANTHSCGTAPVPPDLKLPRRPALPELMEDDEEERFAAAAEAGNQDPKPKSKSKSKSKPKPVARDIHGNKRHVLTISKAHLFAYSVVEGAWQTRGLITNWANAIFQLTWEQEFPGLAFQAPSPRTIQCMVNAQPAFRGRSKEALRPFTEFYWGFKKPASTPADIAHNIALAKKLLPNNFHCLSYDPPYGHYKSEALKLAIAIVLFNNPTAVGVVFSGYVNPCPETAAAYTLANMQFSIEEYSSGRFQPRELNASEMLNKYVAHLRGLKAARRKAKGRFKRLAQEWFNFGMEYSGAAELEDPFTQAVTLASDVRPDTPTLDETSEHDYLPEPELEEHESELTEGGRYSKRAKGKGRA